MNPYAPVPSFPEICHSTELPSGRVGVGRVLLFGVPLSVAILLLAQFALLVAAEFRLQRAADAGATEMLLPGATRASVVATVRRHLADPNLRPAAQDLQLSINRRISPLIDSINVTTGDQIGVSLSIPASEIVPDLLAPIGLSLRCLRVRGSAQRSFASTRH